MAKEMPDLDQLLTPRADQTALLRRFACECSRRVLHICDDKVMPKLLAFAIKRISKKPAPKSLKRIGAESTRLYDSLYPGHSAPSAAVLALSAVGEAAFTESALTAATNAASFAADALGSFLASDADEELYDEVYSEAYNTERIAQIELLRDIKLKELGIQPLSGSRFKKFTRKEIRHLEDRINTSLPASYKQFLLKYGGCEFSALVNCTPHSVAHHFGWFYNAVDLIQEFDSYSEALPVGVISIGDNGGGDQLCIGVAGKFAGKIYFHDHCIGWQADAEKYTERGEAVPENIRDHTVRQLAASFDEFILAMVSDP
jgi:hypothetical protein